MVIPDIFEELRRRDCPAPPQPFGEPGFGPIALLLVVGDEPAIDSSSRGALGPNPGCAISQDYCHWLLQQSICRNTMPSSLGAATTVWLRPPTWRAPDARSWCSKSASCWAGVPSPRRSGRAIASPPAPTSPA